MSGWQSWVSVASVAAVLLGTERAGHADPVTLFAITFEDELLAIGSSTGTGTLIGRLDRDTTAFGLADRGSDLWTFDPGQDVMLRLDPWSGATLEVVAIGVRANGEGAVTYRSDGTGFLTQANRGSAGNKFWSFDVTANPGESDFIGRVDPSMDGMDFDSSDQLYGLSHATGSLYRIDEATGRAELVGPTGLSGGVNTQGLTFAPNGDLFGAINNSLYRINPETGAATLIGDIGFDKVSGLSFLPAVAIPVPAAAWIGSILLGILGIMRMAKVS